MSHVRRVLPAFVVTSILLAAPLALGGRPAPEPIVLPGPQRGEARTTWIAPWVSQTVVSVGGMWSGTIRWHDPAGEVVREVAAAPTLPGHVGDGSSSNLAINGDWRVVLEDRPGADRFVDATRDSRTLVHEYQPTEGEVAIDVHVKGKLVATVGPYPRLPVGEVALGADGSLALPIAGASEGAPSRVVVAGPDGKVRFVASAGVALGTYAAYRPAPGGAGVLVETAGQEPGQSVFEYRTAKGRASRLAILPNPHVMAWAPGRSTALVMTSANETRWLLVDFDAGKILWDVPDPGLSQSPTSQVDVGERYVLLSGLAFRNIGKHEGPVRCLYALDLEDGSVAARWLPVPCSRFTTEPGSFTRLGERLYLLTETEFCEVRAVDVDTRMHGWRGLAPRFPGRDARARLFRKVSGILTGDDWRLVDTAPESVPDGWRTLDGGGYLVDNEMGNRAFRVWFLPEDWIGIRTPGERVRESVLAGDGVKVIVQSAAKEVHDAVWRLFPTTVSLVNGGWSEAEENFEGREAEVESRVAKLVGAYARDPGARDAAALSLIQLGVPARSLIRACAAGGGGTARHFSVSALGYFGDAESVRVLCEVMNGRDDPHRVVKYAAIALGGIADPKTGPALLKALGVAEDKEALGQIAQSLGRIRHRAAVPALLERLTEESPAWLRAEYAKALADLRATEAVPAIRSLVGDVRFTSEWIRGLWTKTWLGREPSVALLRLTGDWGPPSKGVRALLLPPAPAGAGEPMKLALVLENVGEEDLIVVDYLTGGKLRVSGAEHDVGPEMWNGNASLKVNDLWVWEIDLEAIVTKPGVYRMRYEQGELRSPELVLTVE